MWPVTTPTRGSQERSRRGSSKRRPFSALVAAQWLAPSTLRRPRLQRPQRDGSGGTRPRSGAPRVAQLGGHGLADRRHEHRPRTRPRSPPTGLAVCVTRSTVRSPCGRADGRHGSGACDRPGGRARRSGDACLSCLARVADNSPTLVLAELGVIRSCRRRPIAHAEAPTSHFFSWSSSLKETSCTSAQLSR